MMPYLAFAWQTAKLTAFLFGLQMTLAGVVLCIIWLVRVRGSKSAKS